MAFIKAQHAAGKHYEWNVTEPDVHISGDTAWIAYVNKGSIADASGTTKQNWLESAFLEKQAGNWKIVFMHSTRVPPPPKENHGKMRSKQMFKANSSKNSLQFQRFGTAPKPRLMNEGNVGRIDEPDDGIIERRDFR